MKSLAAARVAGNPVRGGDAHLDGLDARGERDAAPHRIDGETDRDLDRRAVVRAGGELLFNAQVASINVKDGGVRGVTLADGTSVRAPIVVSNADARHTYDDLVGAEHLPERLVRRYRNMTLSLSGFVLYSATTLDVTQFEHAVSESDWASVADLYGTFMESFEADGDDLEEWLSSNRRALADGARQALDPLARELDRAAYAAQTLGLTLDTGRRLVALYGNGWRDALALIRFLVPELHVDGDEQQRPMPP